MKFGHSSEFRLQFDADEENEEKIMKDFHFPTKIPNFCQEFSTVSVFYFAKNSLIFEFSDI